VGGEQLLDARIDNAVPDRLAFAPGPDDSFISPRCEMLRQSRLRQAHGFRQRGDLASPHSTGLHRIIRRRSLASARRTLATSVAGHSKVSRFIPGPRIGASQFKACEFSKYEFGCRGFAMEFIHLAEPCVLPAGSLTEGFAALTSNGNGLGGLSDESRLMRASGRHPRHCSAPGGASRRTPPS